MFSKCLVETGCLLKAGTGHSPREALSDTEGPALVAAVLFFCKAKSAEVRVVNNTYSSLDIA